MAFKWAVARCESMRPKNARLAVPVAAVVAGVVAVADTVGLAAVETAAAVADTVGVAAVETAAAVVDTVGVAAVETAAAVVVAAVHAAGNA
jgi:hypothetical protein